jgi:ubiquinol-cytochrome c reductase cytochrome b subunit
MVVQIVRGFLLSLYYNDSIYQAFYSVNYIIVEVERGYLVRFIHSRGASLLFFLIFIHMGRGLWYKSYYIVEVWQVGVVLFLLLIGVSFLGYVLP